MEISNIQSTRYGKTENGTPIVEAGKETDKDIFLKMLVGQMANQDPFNPQDPTQYITQLAQFSTLEQMMALNDSMNYLIGVNNGVLVNSALQTASSLIGKNVEVSSLDEDGKYQDYSGKVQSVAVKDGTVVLELKLENGEVKEFEYSELVKVN
ncbi:Basal-body rod modification protein flgD [uncultured Clostridium sp.]|uniref:flagellar hook capping FlgD N-terminal domain-containing protein n=1 Tax=uncultured Clostridium sp. TaxID=59620 RepID=UPI0008224FE3|nr:flagellar hook capping FlgD N-terminal domain-containing protein [uncultured Clostridium sp.]SCJ98173.1 Basal-body rod modification protein flgD [uncultured Clostridium sp.]